jgi:hypothetical protein
MTVNIKRFSLTIIGSIALATILFNSLSSNAQEYDEEDNNSSSWYQRQAQYHQKQASQYQKQAEFDREMDEYEIGNSENSNTVLSQEDSSENDNSEIGNADVFKDKDGF